MNIVHLCKATHCLALLAVAVPALTVTGCGDGKVKVSGQVTFQQQPVEQGSIRFEGADGQGPTDGSMIANGHYSTSVVPGKKTVQIEGYRKVGESQHDPNDPSSPVLPQFERVVNTSVVVEITTSRDDLDFALPLQ